MFFFLNSAIEWLKVEKGWQTGHKETQLTLVYNNMVQGKTDRETGPENERHRERAIERVRPIVTFALGKASGLRRGAKLSPMLPIFASVIVSLTPLSSPHSLSPAIAPSLQRGYASDRRSLVATPSLPLSGIQRGFASDRRSLVATPSLHPPASREASPLTGLWQPSGIDQQRSLGTTCGIRIDNYMIYVNIRQFSTL